MAHPLTRLLPLLPAALLGLAGCVSRDSIERAVGRDREASAAAWSNRLDHADRDVPRLSGELSLPDALKLALANNKQLQATVLEKDISDGRTTESYSEVLPTLTGAAGYSRVGPADTYLTTAPTDPFDQYAASLHIRQPLYKGGAIESALKAAHLYAYWADELIRSATQGVLYNAALAFYDVLLAERLQAAASATLASAADQLKVARDMAAAGSASRYDVLRAEVAVANAESDLIQQENRNRLARTRLFQVMGVTADPALRIAGDLVFEKSEPGLGAALRLAHLNRPDLYQADLLVRLQRESLQVAKSRYYPTVSGVASYDWVLRENRTPDEGDWLRAWTAGVQVDVPIFDGMAREGRVDQERALLKRREAELAGAEEQVLLEINQSLANLQDAEKVVASQRLNLARAREALNLAEAGFREGVNTSTDLSDARAALRLAEGLSAQALYAHTVARLSLRRATGLLEPRDADPSSLKEFQPGAPP
jgi:outer membrane protein TolC